MYVKVGSLYDVMNESIDMNLDSLAEDMVDYSVNYLIETGDTYYLEALAYQDYSVFNEDMWEDLGFLRPGSGTKLDQAFEKHGWSKYTRDDQKILFDVMAQKNIEAQEEKIKDSNFLMKLPRYAKLWLTKGRNFVARQIQKLNIWARKIRDKIEDVPEEKRSFWQKVQNVIMKVIDMLSKAAHNFIGGQGGAYIADYDQEKQNFGKFGAGKNAEEKRKALYSLTTNDDRPNTDGYKLLTNEKFLKQYYPQ